MLSEKQCKHIQDILFANESIAAYAIVDGASCPRLRFKLHEMKADYRCLWSGQLEPDIEEVAPYLIALEQDHDFTKWIIKEGFGNHWNIFMLSELGIEAFRKTVRKLQLVRSPDGRSMLFRFYDPRVMEMILPTCGTEQLLTMFDNVSCALYESDDATSLVAARIEGSANDAKLIVKGNHL
jgi:hypothetical protein